VRNSDVANRKGTLFICAALVGLLGVGGVPCRAVRAQRTKLSSTPNRNTGRHRNPRKSLRPGWVSGQHLLRLPAGRVGTGICDVLLRSAHLRRELRRTKNAVLPAGPEFVLGRGGHQQGRRTHRDSQIPGEELVWRAAGPSGSVPWATCPSSSVLSATPTLSREPKATPGSGPTFDCRRACFQRAGNGASLPTNQSCFRHSGPRSKPAQWSARHTTCEPLEAAFASR
jgi:hypothetical protein